MCGYRNADRAKCGTVMLLETADKEASNLSEAEANCETKILRNGVLWVQ